MQTIFSENKLLNLHANTFCKKFENEQCFCEIYFRIYLSFREKLIFPVFNENY